jgi:prevent-host-death family protein
MKHKKQGDTDTIPISEFKAKCLKLLDETGVKGRQYTITKKGEPIAKVVPIKKRAAGTRRGSLQGMIQILGDIVNFDTSEDWEVLKS